MKMRLGFCLLALALAGAAQSVDLAAGGGGVASGGGIGGSFWPSFSGTAMFSRYFGANADFSWRAQQLNFITGPRPKLFSINAAFRTSPRLVVPELDLGFAGERFITNKCDNCVVIPGGPPPSSPGQTYYGAHMGVSVVVHASPRWFVRGGYHLYVGKQMHHPSRFAIEIGYTFGRLWK